MTDTANTESAASSADQPSGTMEHLDPALLDIGDNVRDDAALSKAFIANIAENGVLVPITGVRDPERPEVIRVRNGQQRTLAAREVGLSSVPVYVLPSSAVDASQETITASCTRSSPTIRSGTSPTPSGRATSSR